MKTELPGGTVHKLPKDLKQMLEGSSVAESAWLGITPLARNEFICWIEDAKKPETRVRRIEIAKDKLENAERRPCCWIGCIHRTDKAPSKSQKGILKLK
ncbi:MAG TPA: YdeI/OmpD-associated family protein [Candidatus Saccharibacteria bacterium]|jgi:uncharacterized protein YdeI (YjbR/CyaY-like superfamily)|nr:YdeI/OmpD-associated family protein [Candidatus Saccharibacteria bacterium]